LNFKLKIVDKFIFSQVFQATLVCLFLFSIVWIAPEILKNMIGDVLAHKIGVQEGLFRLVHELPKVLAKALPVSILLGATFTFDKLSKDSELSILRGIGLSFTRIMAPVLVLGVVLTIGCYFVGDRLIPRSCMRIHGGYQYNNHFVYIQKDEKERPKQGVIVSNFTRKGIKNVIVVNFAPDTHDDVATFKTILFAPYALKFDDKWILPEATEYLINENGIFEKITSVKDYPVIEGSDAKDVYDLMLSGTKRDRDFTNAQLWYYTRLLKKQDFQDEHNFMLAKFYQRFFHPLTCVLFAMIGCLLGFAPPRSVRLVGFTLAVGLIFAYYITLPFFDLMAEKGVMWPFMSAALPIVGFVVVIFVAKKMKDL